MCNDGDAKMQLFYMYTDFGSDFTQQHQRCCKMNFSKLKCCSQVFFMDECVNTRWVSLACLYLISMVDFAYNIIV